MSACNSCVQVDCSCKLPPQDEELDSTCPPHDRRNIKTEFPVEPFICSPEVCKIYGSHDRNQPPKPPYPRAKSKTVENTLGSPIGLVKSSFGVKTIDAKGNDLHALRFGTYLKGFANIYLMPEEEWETEVMDEIMKEGQTLFSESKKKNPANSDIVILDIYSDIEAKICRTFDFNGYTFQVELNDKFEVNVPKKNDQSYQETDLTVQFVKIALKQFFKQSCYCLLKVTNWYMLVWRSKGVYFVLDVYGRRSTDLISDRDKGFGMLICVKTLTNVEHLIWNLSGIQKSDIFNMRELRIVKLVGPDGKTMTREYGKRVNEYEIVNSSYAYLKSALHLSLNPAEVLRRRSAFPACLTALLASKIDHPATWNEKMLDKIICFGVYVCRHCWEQCLRDFQSPLEDISRFPNKLKIGQFYASYKLMPQYYEGVWKCVPNYKHSELFIAIEKCFECATTNLMVQLNQQFYAVWKKGSIFYLFDPYRHRVCWNTASEDKYSALRMFSTLESFCNVFQQILLESNKTTKFYLHNLQITLIEPVDKLGGLTTLETLQTNVDDEDIKSLNETICFEEDETQCLKELGDISDYEDEEMIATVAQITLSSESEAEEVEEAMEEEEGGAKVNMDDVESSSSGDDHGGRRRKKKRTKGERDREKEVNEKSAAKNKKKGKKNEKDKDKDKDKDKGKGKQKAAAKEKTKPAKEPKEPKEKEPKEKKAGGDKSKKKDKNKKKGSDESSEEEAEEKKKKEKKEKKEKPKDDEREKDDSKKEKEAKQKKTKEESKSTEKEKKEDKKPEPPKPEAPKSEPRKPEPPKMEPPKIEESKGETPKIDTSQIDDYDQKRTTDVRPKPKARRDSNDENELKNKPNNYPGYSKEPRNMAVVGSESGTYESLCKLLRAGFKCADRIMTMTPWGNYVVFRGHCSMETLYFLFDGCTCNVNRFRHLDLNCGTAGLLCFQSLHDVITYMIDTQKMNPCLKKHRKNVVADICKQFC